MHIAFLLKSILILKEWGKKVQCKLVLDMHAYLLKIIKPTWFFLKTEISILGIAADFPSKN